MPSHVLFFRKSISESGIKIY